MANNPCGNGVINKTVGKPSQHGSADLVPIKNGIM